MVSIRDNMGNGIAIADGFVGTLGVERDATGLLFIRNRYYDAAMGRFVQRDPIGLRAGDINWYRYCRNDVALNVDADGLEQYVFCSNDSTKGFRKDGKVDTFKPAKLPDYTYDGRDMPSKKMPYDMGEKFKDWLADNCYDLFNDGGALQWVDKTFDLGITDFPKDQGVVRSEYRDYVYKNYDGAYHYNRGAYRSWLLLIFLT